MDRHARLREADQLTTSSSFLRQIRSGGTVVGPLGLGAGLLAHEILRGIAGLRLGASSFAAHEHAALAPTAWLEVVLAMWLCAVTARDALERKAPPCYRGVAHRASTAFFVSCAIGIIVLASLTLFGMEFSESGAAALGAGWLGGAIAPGAFVLTGAAGAAIFSMHFLRASKHAGFERLVALFASLLACFDGPRRSNARTAIVRRRRALRAAAPCSRHAGLRAPPA